MARSTNLLFLAGLIQLLLLPACSDVRATGATATGRPKVLRYGLRPSEDEAQIGSVNEVVLRNYLERKLHMPVVVTRLGGYSPMIEAMSADQIDVASFGPFGYLIASRKAGAEAIVTRGDQNGKLGGYSSVIAVPKNSPIHSMADLKQHSKEVIFAFSDPASTSGHLVPRAYLESLGIDPERDFKQLVFAGTHPATALTVKAGKVGAGAMMEMIIPLLIKTGKVASDDFRILWTSETIPPDPIAVRRSLPAAFKEELRQALLSVAKDDPALMKEFQKLYRRTDLTLVPVNDAAYDGIRKLARNVKNIDLLER